MLLGAVLLGAVPVTADAPAGSPSGDDDGDAVGDAVGEGEVDDEGTALADWLCKLALISAKLANSAAWLKEGMARADSGTTKGFFSPEVSEGGTTRSACA